MIVYLYANRYISICHPFSAMKYCTTSRALKAVAVSVIACALLASMHGYLSIFQESSQKCETRPEAMMPLNNGTSSDLSLWSVWTWTTELTVFLVIPIIIFIFNLLVIIEVRRMSRSAETSISSSDQKKLKASQRGASLKGALIQHQPPSKDNTSNGAATTVMLLSVSFYMIVTTLPATLTYVLYVRFPEGSLELDRDLVQSDPTWSKYFQYILSKKIVDEFCLSHYACNFILYLITGTQFRRALVAIFKRSKAHV